MKISGKVLWLCLTYSSKVQEAFPGVLVLGSKLRRPRQSRSHACAQRHRECTNNRVRAAVEQWQLNSESWGRTESDAEHSRVTDPLRQGKRPNCQSRPTEVHGSERNPEYVHLDNEPRKSLAKLVLRNFNGRLRHDRLKGEIFLFAQGGARL